MTSFVNALRSETTKIFSLRSTWIWVILLTGSIYGPMVLMGLLSENGTKVDWETLSVGALIFSLLGISYAGSTVAAEYSEKVFAHAFISQDRRSLWLAARTILLLVFLAVNAVLGVALARLAIWVLPKTEFVGGDMSRIWITVLMTISYVFIAECLAVLTRSRVAAVAAPLAWMLVVEPLLGAAARFEVGRIFWLATPGTRATQLGEALSGTDSGMDTGWQFMQIQPSWFNVLVIVAWIVLTLSVSLAVNARRDVR